MTHTQSIAVSAALAALLGSAAHAQTTTFDNTGLRGDSAVEDANENLAEDIEDDFDRQTRSFGNEGRAQGFTGSVALRATADTGDSQQDNDDSLDLGVGSNLGYVWGPNGVELGLYYAYSEADGDTDENSLLYSLQYTRDINPQLYGFAKLQGTYDGETDRPNTANTFERENDVFLGFGAGYRVIDTAQTQWSIQAGPGYRFASFRDIGAVVPGADNDDINEAAFSLSSEYLQRINERVYLTNDTDIIASDSDTVLYNDLGLNVSMTDVLALRTSVQSEYHTDPAPGNKSTEHQFGVSLVYTLN